MGTAYEQLIGKLMDAEGDPGKVAGPSRLGCRAVAGELLVRNPKKALLDPDAVLKPQEPQKGIPVPSSGAPVSDGGTEGTPQTAQ